MHKRIFITGIPTSGKSHLGRLLAEKTGAIYVELDDMRADLVADERYEKWVNFYSNQDEAAYYASRTPDERWTDLVAQSEGLWPAILEKIGSYKDEARPVIFEGVNILPHLAKRDLDFPGVVLIGRSLEETFERIVREQRWGETDNLKQTEADNFFNVERPRYKAEAKKHGYPVFETAEEALPEALKLLGV